MEAGAFHSIVFFAGDCTFKTEMPPNVLRRGLTEYITSFQEVILSPEVTAQCVEALEGLALGTDRKRAARGHQAALKARRRGEVVAAVEVPPPPALPAASGPPELPAKDGVPNCPKCSAPMVERMAKKGARAGQSFWGCSQFPKCRGTISGE